MCHRKLPHRAEAINCTVVQPVLKKYGAETWALKRKELLLVRPDVRMIRWVMNISVREHKTTQVVQLAGVEGIEVKLTMYFSFLSTGREEKKRYLKKCKIASLWEKKKRKIMQFKEGECK